LKDNGPMSERSKLGTILIQSKIISQDDVDRALEEQARSGVRLGEALLQLGIVAHDDVGWALANQLNIPFIALASAEVDPEAVKLVPESLARQYKLIPLIKIEKELSVVIEDPLNQKAIQEIEKVTGCKVNVCIGLPSDISEKINKIYGPAPLRIDDPTGPLPALFDMEERKSINADYSGETFLRKLLDYAIRKRSSSIHVETHQSGVRIRFRTEGRIEEIGEIPAGWFLILHNKLRSILEMAESKEKFTDGFLNHSFNDRTYLFQASIAGAKHGASLALLSLTHYDFPKTCEELPIDDKTTQAIQKIIEGRSGLVIVVGADKRDLFSFVPLLLEKKQAQKQKTIAVGSIPGFAYSSYMQIKVRMEDSKDILEGMGFAVNLDPDILYVEKLWDRHAFEFALQSSLENVFFISTLYFPETLNALNWMLESIGNRTLLSSALRGVIGIRVFKALCPYCKQVDLTCDRQSLLKNVSQAESEIKTIYKAKGCERCDQLGYLGSAIAIEPIVVDQELSNGIQSGIRFSKIKEMLTKKGHRTIKQKAADFLCSGVIDIDEFEKLEKR